MTQSTRLFNVAGVSGPIGAKVVIGINFVGTRELTEALLPRMAAGSSIVMTSSLAASQYLDRRELSEELLATTTREEALAWCDTHAVEVGTGYAVSKDTLLWYTLTKAVRAGGKRHQDQCCRPGDHIHPDHRRHDQVAWEGIPGCDSDAAGPGCRSARAGNRHRVPGQF